VLLPVRRGVSSSGRRILLFAALLGVLAVYSGWPEEPRRPSVLDSGRGAAHSNEVATTSEVPLQAVSENGPLARMAPGPGATRFEAFHSGGAPASNVPVLAFGARARLVVHDHVKCIGVTNHEGVLVVPAVESWGASVFCAESACGYLSQFQAATPDAYRCVLPALRRITLRCVDRAGQPIAGVSVRLSRSALPHDAHDSRWRQGPVAEQRQIYRATTDDEGIAVVEVVDAGGGVPAGRLAASLHKAGHVVVDGLQWPGDTVPDTEHVHEICLARVQAVAWQCDDDEIISHRLDCDGAAWDQTLPRRLWLCSRTASLPEGRSQVYVARDQRPLRVRGTFFLRHCGVVHQDLHVFDLTEPLVVTKVAGPRGEDRTGTLRVQVQDAGGQLLEGLPVVLTEVASRAVRIVASGTDLRLPTGRYSLRLSGSIEAVLEAAPEVAVQPAAPAAATLILRGAWSHFELIVSPDGLLAVGGDDFHIQVRSADGSSARLLMGGPWQQQRVCLPSGPLRIEGQIGALSIVDVLRVEFGPANDSQRLSMLLR
jgi:hypothetical protein